MHILGKRPIILLRVILIFTIVLSIWAFTGVINVMQLNNTLPFHSNWVFVWSFLLVLTILMLVLLGLTWNLKISSSIIGISEKVSSLKISKPLSLTIFMRANTNYSLHCVTLGSTSNWCQDLNGFESSHLALMVFHLGSGSDLLKYLEKTFPGWVPGRDCHCARFNIELITNYFCSQ